jgi:hypothetical protein
VKTTDFDSIDVQLLPTQAMIQIINANRTYCAWPRGSGKTSAGIGPRFLHLSKMMPKTQVLLFSDTYGRLWDRIVPNFTTFLTSDLGLLEGIDFVKYKKPPESWEKPFITLDNFENVISFATGIAICLVSLHVPGSANAFNAQAAIGDEIKYCDPTKIDTEVLPAIRGNKKMQNLFGHLPEFLSVWMFTDKFSDKIKWYLKKKELMDVEAVEMVYAWQMRIFELEAENNASDDEVLIKKNFKQIAELREKANAIRKYLVYYSDMPSRENEATLGEYYFKQMERTCGSRMEYEVAILNKDPDKVEHCFYPTFTALNKYSGIEDYDPNKPFYAAMDYNFRICPMPVAQTGVLPGSVYETMNVVDYMYVLEPLGIEDVVKNFADKYREHRCKEIHFVFDHTSIGRNPMKVTFKSSVMDAFDKNAWIIYEHYIGQAPDHDNKFKNIRDWLQNNADNAVRINQVKCDVLIKSIEQSPAKMVNGATKKDKDTEKDLNFPAEESTHGSDAFDMLLIGFFEYGIANDSSLTTTPLSIR